MNHALADNNVRGVARRDALKLALAGLAVPATALAASPRKDEYAPGNIKVATRLPIRSATDEDLLFLRQLGLPPTPGLA